MKQPLHKMIANALKRLLLVVFLADMHMRTCCSGRPDYAQEHILEAQMLEDLEEIRVKNRKNHLQLAAQKSKQNINVFFS